MTQLVLSFPRKVNFDPVDYMPFTSHTAVLSVLDRLAQTPGMAFVYGQNGVGKSHFLSVAAHRLGLPLLTPTTLPADPTTLTGAVVDDVHLLDPAGQRVVFHLFNHLKGQGSHTLLLAADRPAVALPLLADLTSRLQTVEHVEIPPPQEADLTLLLAKLAYDRQLRLPPAVSAYIMTRADRSPAVLEGVLDALDTLSLERKRRVTIPLVRHLLEGTAP
jgi:DnaA family protein